MALTIAYVPGYTFTTGEQVTIAKLNLLGNPTINLEGSIGSIAIGAGAVQTSNCAVGMLAASAAGEAIMANGFFSADATGRAKFAAGFFGTDATSAAIFADGFFAPYAPTVGSARNLISTNASSSTATVTADEVVLKDANGNPFLATSVSVTLNIASSGANGLDTGAVSDSQWYYIYVIYNGTTVSGLFSASSSSPTMPSGYTYKALVGVVYNNASGNFVNFYQQDRDIFVDTISVFTGKASAASNTYESYSAGAGGSDVNMNTVVPPNAKRLRGVLGDMNTGNPNGIAIAADANGLGAVQVTASQVGSASQIDTFTVSGMFMIPLKTSQTFYWKSTSTSARNQLNVNGYSI